MSTPPFPDMDELLQRLLDDEIQPDEMERLQRAIREDVRVRDYYIDSMLVSAVIRRSSQVTGELSASDLIRAISNDGHQRHSNRFGRYVRAIAAVLVVGMLTLAAVFLLRPKDPGPPVGRLAGKYEAQWRGPHPHLGQPLYVGAYELYEGVARMELDRGTSLLLEAPCQVELISANEMTLRTGRVVVMDSSQAKGFQVRTPTAVVTDLGTEFGVIARSDGSTEAHVLKGRISVALNPNEPNQSTPLIVNEGQAAAVDTTGKSIRGGLAARADMFLLQLPSHSQPASSSKRVNLADIVGGGNGRGTGKLNQGIDLVTGKAFKGLATTIRRTRRNEFRPAPQFGAVDGVFVPNGAFAPVIINSTGLTFSECPRTMGSYYGGAINSGKFYDIPSQRSYVARLNGVSFGTSEHPALNLHPNAGITFDLDEIRRDNPGIQIERFTAVCSIPKDLPHPQFSPADVWVLLDGVVHLHLNYPAEKHVVENVDVPIPADARFLTLVTTCSGRADYSWILFGDPFLGPL